MSLRKCRKISQPNHDHAEACRDCQLLPEPSTDRTDPADATLAARARFRDIAATLRETCGQRPGGRVIFVGDHVLERDVVAAAQLPAERSFGG